MSCAADSEKPVIDSNLERLTVRVLTREDKSRDESRPGRQSACATGLAAVYDPLVRCGVCSVWGSFARAGIRRRYERGRAALPVGSWGDDSRRHAVR
jgi:hypothetical protein